MTALFDVLDGTVARRSNKSSTFGAFLDSTLDRVADGALLGGLAVFYALNPVHHNVPMMVVCLAGLIGAYLTSYIRARAEALGFDAKVGMVQRPERIVLLSAPQAFFGLALNGWVLGVIIVIPHASLRGSPSCSAWRSCIEQTTARGAAPADPAHHRKDLLAASPTSDRHAPIVLKGE